MKTLRLPSVLRALDRKLLRDLWAMKGQAIAIAFVIAGGAAVALFRDGERWAMYRVEDGRARSTRVDVGRDNARSAQILDGIEPGQTIVLYPGEQIADGTRVAQRP